MRPRSSGLRHGQRAWASSGPGQQQQSLPRSGPPFTAKNIWADIGQRRPHRTPATHPQVARAAGTAVTGAGGHGGVAGLGLVRGHRGSGPVWAGSAQAWGGAPTWSLGVMCL